MLKRTLMVVAISGLAAQANAISLVTANTAINITPQEIGAGVTVPVPAFTITVGDDLDLNGKSLQVEFSKPIHVASAPASFGIATCSGSEITSISYAGLTNGNKTANYTIVSDNSKSPATCVLTAATTFFAAASDVTVAAPITAKSSFTLIGGGVSPSLAKSVLARSANQFATTVATPADQKIDVNGAKKKYVGGAADTIVFSVTDLHGGATVTGVTGQTFEYTVAGNFAWADNPLTAAFDPTTTRQSLTPIGITNATYVPAKSTTTSLVFSDTANNSPYTLTLLPLVDKNLTNASAADDVVAVEIPVQTFSVTTKALFTDGAFDATASALNAAGTQLVAAKAAGSHTLNGATTKIFAVPFGAEVESHSIFVSNKGASTGAITGVMNWNGGTAVNFSLGNVEAGANKYLNIMAALDALGEKPTFGRADIALTVNSPEADITFTAGYTTATGRANLFMQQQGNIDGVSASAKASAAAAAADAAKTCDNLAAGADLNGTGGHSAVSSTYYNATACP